MQLKLTLLKLICCLVGFGLVGCSSNKKVRPNTKEIEEYLINRPNFIVIRSKSDSFGIRTKYFQGMNKTTLRVYLIPPRVDFKSQIEYRCVIKSIEKENDDEKILVSLKEIPDYFKNGWYDLTIVFDNPNGKELKIRMPYRFFISEGSEDK